MVAKVAFAFSKLPAMAPFRHLLSTQSPFVWFSELEDVFQQSKEGVLRECKTGSTTLTPNCTPASP